MAFAGPWQPDRKGKSRFVIWIIVLTFPWLVNEAKAEVDFYTVLEALKEYEETIHALCVIGKYQESFDTVRHGGGNYTRQNAPTVINFACDIANRRFRYDIQRSFVYSKFSKEPFETRSVESFDGEKAYRLSFTYIKEPTGAGMPPGRPLKLRIDNSSPTAPGNLHPLKLTGSGMENHVLPSLVNRLETEPCTWEGSDRVSGMDCFKINIRPVASNQLLTVWFDPTHDFLPRRQEMRRLGDDGDPEETASSSIDTTEFQQFPLPDGEKIWFPASARSQTTGIPNQTFKLLDLTFTTELPMEQFRIDPETLSTGTLISDRLNNVNYHVGGDEGRSLYEEWQRLEDVVSERLEKKLGPPPTSGSPSGKGAAKPTETNSESDSLWLYTNLCFLTLLGCAWIFYQVRKSRIRKPG